MARRTINKPVQGFMGWMSDVDYQVGIKIGCSVNDLPDCPFREWYDNEWTAKRAALKAIKMAKDEGY